MPETGRARPWSEPIRSPCLVSWSSGKDSAWALHEVRRRGELEPVGLLTTVTSGYERVSMHGVRYEILEAQARQTGLPLSRVSISPGASNAEYESAFVAAIVSARASGIERIIFGDLFLEDVRSYRERVLNGTGVIPEFPLWGRDTAGLAREMIAAGLKAVVVCVDPTRVPSRWAGMPFDQDFLAGLPPGADPCGENGEFHTCVLDAPMFASPIPASVGERIERNGFVFADLISPDSPVTGGGEEALASPRSGR